MFARLRNARFVGVEVSVEWYSGWGDPNFQTLVMTSPWSKSDCVAS